MPEKRHIPGDKDGEFVEIDTAAQSSHTIDYVSAEKKYRVKQVKGYDDPPYLKPDEDPEPHIEAISRRTLIAFRGAKRAADAMNAEEGC